MYSFKNDYSEGAHPRILQRLLDSNDEQAEGYGEDLYAKEAKKLIMQQLQHPDSEIYFFSGGTQTNATCISAILRPHEAAISAHTGHIATHETGAIEATGHKILTRQVSDGKLTPSHIHKTLSEHTDEHMVKPRLVYLSNPTEVGTIYSKKELIAIHELCIANNLYLFVDGARLGSALASPENDLTLHDFALYTHAFYIGGTKNGALLGEALVVNSPELQKDFRFHMKQKGALLAKGRLLSIQFLELFKDNLFIQLGEHANEMAHSMRTAIQRLGYSFLVETTTNQLFPILPLTVVDKLRKNFQFYVWEKIDDQMVALRLVTSWATTVKATQDFILALEESSK